MQTLKITFPLIAILFCFQLYGQIPDSIPAPVLDFYGSGVYANQINDRAPVETRQFGQLNGIWYCTGTMPDPLGKVDKVTYTAFWAWKYILDGYGVQDFWFQGKNEFLYWNYFKRDMMLTQLRVYDTKEKIWKVAFINNNAGEVPGRMFGTFTAQEQAEGVVMDFMPRDTTNMNRIIFFDITEESFEWRVENSKDSGETWKVMSTISAKRMK
ncbi:MAG: hypothetical protein ABJH72_12690 [Reichenbachiella sp.]|uniref:hypothetical protein n=1 Tax=Reichenbachiella sp. TaxID=2184521 RepID=UPI00326711C3